MTKKCDLCHQEINLKMHNVVHIETNGSRGKPMHGQCFKKRWAYGVNWQFEAKNDDAS